MKPCECFISIFCFIPLLKIKRETCGLASWLDWPCHLGTSWSGFTNLSFSAQPRGAPAPLTNANKNKGHCSRYSYSRSRVLEDQLTMRYPCTKQLDWGRIERWTPRCCSSCKKWQTSRFHETRHLESIVPSPLSASFRLRIVTYLQVNQVINVNIFDTRNMTES